MNKDPFPRPLLGTGTCETVIHPAGAGFVHTISENQAAIYHYKLALEPWVYSPIKVEDLLRIIDSSNSVVVMPEKIPKFVTQEHQSQWYELFEADLQDADLESIEVSRTAATNANIWRLHQRIENNCYSFYYLHSVQTVFVGYEMLSI